MARDDLDFTELREACERARENVNKGMAEAVARVRDLKELFAEVAAGERDLGSVADEFNARLLLRKVGDGDPPN